MKMIIVALALVAIATAAVDPEPIGILRSSFDQTPEGGYNFGFETENGIVRTEVGEVKEALDADNKPVPVVVVRGSYSYTDGDGKLETISYFADETGYHAEGDSLPKVSRR